MEELAVVASANLIDGGRVQIDEDGSRDIFAIAGFGEEGLERPGISNVLGIRVGTAIGSEAVLEEVAISGVNGGSYGAEARERRCGVSQFPCAVAELGASLAQMEMKDLEGRECQPRSTRRFVQVVRA